MLYITKGIISNIINIEKGLDILLRIVRKTNYNKKYIQFEYLADDIYNLDWEGYPIYNIDLNKENIKEYIIEECNLFLIAITLNLPSNIDEYVFCEDCSYC